METVSIAISAELYVKLYQQHQEGISAFIESTLREQSDADGSKTVIKLSFRPGIGTITGRVWEIADEIKAENGSAGREQVVQQCVNEGLNMNTANTQYSAWKKEYS